MIPPQTKSLILSTVQKYAPELKKFKNSNPVIMLGELKLDRIDQKVKKEAEKLNFRQSSKDLKSEGKNKKYEKRKAAITYRSYTVQFKRKLIQKIRELNSKSDAGLSKIIRAKARQLNIHPKNIFRWFHTKQIKKKEGGRKALFPEMQERLAQFIINNPKMKRKHILRQAKQIMDDLQIPGRQYFNFSKGWYQRFRERLVRRKIIPGKIQVKKEYNENSDSDYDEDDSIIKKEQTQLKSEHEGSVKVEYQSDFSDSQEEEYIKEQSDTNVKDEFVITYSEWISDDQFTDKDEKEQKNQGQEKRETVQNKKLAKKEEIKKQEVKTDESQGSLVISTGSKPNNVSIFASDQSNEVIQKKQTSEKKQG